MSALDDALATLDGYSAGLKNGLANHAPMVAEALDHLGLETQIAPWVEAELERISPRPPQLEPIEGRHWEGALNQPQRFSDWSKFFADAIAIGGWQATMNEWAEKLAPGFVSTAAHGVIRVGHAARALTKAQTGERERELANALAAWASDYMTLPDESANLTLTPDEALANVQLVDASDHAPQGSITEAVACMTRYDAFRPVINWLSHADCNQIAPTFAALFLQSANSYGGAIVFTHAITGLAAARNIGQSVDASVANNLVKRAWQTGCALHAVYSAAAFTRTDLEDGSPGGEAALIAAVLANGDEHVIKLAEACLAFFAESGDANLLLAIERALTLIPPRQDR